MWARLRRLLNRPLFGTVVIPAGARVDPQHFSEAEFPVECPKCGYLLRGLSEERCPECGDPFDRGRLLVEQYIGRHWRRGEKKRLIIQTLVMVCLAMLPSLGVMFLATSSATIISLETAVRLFLWLQVLILVPICISLGLDIREWLRRSQKRKLIVQYLSRR